MDREYVGIRQATQKGYIECEIGGVADFSYPTSKLRRGRVQGGGHICPTLTSQSMGICRIEKVVRGGKTVCSIARKGQLLMCITREFWMEQLAGLSQPVVIHRLTIAEHLVLSRKERMKWRK